MLPLLSRCGSVNSFALDTVLTLLDGVGLALLLAH